MKRRAKLYCLDDDGSWNDIGTGWADIENNRIVVMFDDENIEKENFISNLNSNPEYYQLEGGLYFELNSVIVEIDTLIVFTDEEKGNEYALSFLIPEGREYIWKQIKIFHLQNNADVPKPTLRDLSKLSAFVKKCASSAGRISFSQLILKEDFFDQLLSIPKEILNMVPVLSSNESSDVSLLSSTQKMHFSLLFGIIRDLILANDVGVINFLFSVEKDRIKRVIDCLQYDESIDTRIDHNLFIEKNVKLHMV
jgi:hypothetical protein